MPTTQGVAPGYIILGFQPISTPIEEAMPWIKEGEKENSPLSLGNDPIALRALPLRQGKFLGCSKKLPCFRGAPRRGEGFTYTMCSKIQAFSLYSTPNKEAMPWINEGEKENCQLSIVNCQLNCSGER